jgi:hypothetical protein
MDSRASWAIAANDALEAAGFERHFDHRTLKEQRVSALLARDWRKAAELDREVGQHEGWRVAALRRKHEAGELDELPEYAKAVIESNNNISAINAAHLKMVTSMTDDELERWEREAYFAALEREPERLSIEIEQLHSEALELDAVFDQHSEALELDAVFDQHSEALELDAVFDQHSEALEIDAVFDQHNEALELDAVFDQHNEALELDAVFDQYNEAQGLADVVRSIEKIDLSIENQRHRHSVYSQKAELIKHDYQTLKRQQNALAASEANQNVALKVLNKLLKGIGFKSDSELIEPELKRLSEAFNNAKSERELAKSQLTSLNKQRDELMQLDVSEPLREAVRLLREANASAFESYLVARKSLTAATLDLDKSFRNYAERDLQMIQQDLNKNDYTVEDMQSVQQQLEEFVDSIDAQLHKQAARQQYSQRPQSQPQPQENQQPGPRMG